MSIFKVYLNLSLVTIVFMVVGFETHPSELGIEATACRLLSNKFVASNPWTSYPIVYEPINRGRLTIWTGVSTLPTSEFGCYAHQNVTNDIVMDFANFANKLEWTFYDMNNGAIHHGVSVNHCEDVQYKLSIMNKQVDSYLDCNTIDKIEKINDTSSFIQTSCQDCSHSVLELINSQIRELIKLKLNEQIMDNLYWHVTQLLSSQHFSGPVSLKSNFNGV